MSDLSLSAYFSRIGYTGSPRPDLSTLAELQALHVRAIPFEGLDPLVGCPVKLDLPAIEAKLVASRRGGYCFEHSVLFKSVLEQIGFAVTGLTGRVRWMSPPDSPLSPREHMLLSVEVEGEKRLVDVGFGACLIDEPLRFVTDVEQPTALGTFRLSAADGLFYLAARQPAGWRTMYVFDLVPQIHADYELGNWYTSTSPNVPFLHILILERLSGDRRHKIIADRYIIEGRDGERLEEHPIESADQLERLLDDVFGISPPVPAADLLARVAGAPRP
ncbi:arylamine N-acetyltransferase [Xanthobacter autotrophicus]|uniref:arylamine N-acetyltransferase family protein n=1 Tax=Xanthobacter TaxID=279 RepID=UPI0024AABC00|nr:arylamine N-acetyltransferase [Xanthobacter autotrophicus]MDI4666772.1 arylamine N-acetyltransferase [Xanthobacter autotrophicus]